MPKPEYDNTNRGAIFKNDKKDSEKHPDMTGPLNVDGVDYYIAGWFNESESKGKYMSVKLTKKDDPSVATASSASSSLPF
jgi:uncharacterized protein (DUF736 family)|tara:strand:+ start:4539 stop:4778 length:240 start_codon:yes stop_codon:yes gene_type:complete